MCESCGQDRAIARVVVVTLTGEVLTSETVCEFCLGALPMVSDADIEAAKREGRG
jgi:hypothetical protein